MVGFLGNIYSLLHFSVHFDFFFLQQIPATFIIRKTLWSFGKKRWVGVYQADGQGQVGEAVPGKGSHRSTDGLEEQGEYVTF